jgi:mRNA interferase MazF
MVIVSTCGDRPWVITDQRYSLASGLALVCPLSGRRKPYPFALPVMVDEPEGAVLVDQLTSLYWDARKAKLDSQVEPALLAKVRTYLGVLLGIR